MNLIIALWSRLMTRTSIGVEVPADFQPIPEREIHDLRREQLEVKVRIAAIRRFQERQRKEANT